MTKILGRKFAIFNGGTAIGLSTSCALDSTADTIEVAGIGRAKAYKLGRYAWNMSTEHLLGKNKAMVATLMEAHKQGTPLQMVMGECEVVEGDLQLTDGVTFSGDVLVTSVKVNAPESGYVSCSVSLQGTGELTINYEA